MHPHTTPAHPCGPVELALLARAQSGALRPQGEQDFGDVTPTSLGRLRRGASIPPQGPVDLVGELVEHHQLTHMPPSTYRSTHRQPTRRASNRAAIRAGLYSEFVRLPCQELVA